MAVYRICSEYLLSDSLPKSFVPFQQNDGPERPDVRIKRIDGPISTDGMIIASVLPYVTIWKNVAEDKHVYWVFESRTGLGSLSADSNYSELVYCCTNLPKYVPNSMVNELISPLIRLALKCRMVLNGVITVHAACISMDDQGYALTGPSGIGKSSRARKMCELLGANWISGDRPAIDVERRVVYGVPWDGKEGIFRNVSFPLSAVIDVKRSKQTYIQDIPENKKQQVLMNQVFCPLWDADLAGRVFHLIRQLIRKAPLFELNCDITNESILKAYRYMIEKTRTWEGENSDS